MLFVPVWLCGGWLYLGVVLLCLCVSRVVVYSCVLVVLHVLCVVLL